MTGATSTEPTTPINFVALGRSGKSAWWRYLLGHLIIVSGFVVPALVLVVLFLLIASGGQLSRIDSATGHIKGVDPILNFIVLNVGFWFLVLSAFLVVRFLHNRSFLTLITTAKNVRWKRICIGLCLWSGMVAIQALVGSLIFQKDYKFALQFPEFFYYAPIALFLTPIQCFAEELYFRGYVLQSLGKIMKSQWWLCGISAIIFALPHYSNPEVGVNPTPVLLSFFTIGFVLAYATIRSNSIEIAIGAHIGNNLFDGLIVNYSKSVLDTRSVFLCTQMHPWYEFFTATIIGTLFCLAVDRYVRSAKDSDATSDGCSLLGGNE